MFRLRHMYIPAYVQLVSTGSFCRCSHLGSQKCCDLSRSPISLPSSRFLLKQRQCIRKVHVFVRVKCNFRTSMTAADGQSASVASNNIGIERESLRLLEWPEVSSRVIRFASTSLGRSALAKRNIDGLSPMIEIAGTRERSERLLEETREVYEIEQRFGITLSFSGITEVVDSVRRAEKGVVMTGRELLRVAEFLHAARLLKRVISGVIKDNERNHKAVRFRVLKELIGESRTWPEVERKIYDKLDDYGGIKDSADPKLAAIRAGRRDLLGDIRGTLNDLMNDRPDVVQERLITTRYDRFVVPVKISRKGAFSDSIVHDVSSSGNTAFVEPGAVRSKNDKLREYWAKEKARINAILRGLSEDVVVPILGDLVALQDKLGIIDAAAARARFSRALAAVDVTFEDDMSIHLMGVRHPLLSLAAKDKEAIASSDAERKKEKVGQGESWREKVVPLDFVVRKGVRCAIVTGPNTGGKTVALKTLGLMSLMARAGLFLPASISRSNKSSECARIPFYDRVLADIGDDQSLIQSLSTFSGHVERVKRILSVATTSSLVLLDEIGSGTDPVEGSALGIALLKHLASRAAFTFATTHHGELKALKYDESDGHMFENVSVEFDEVTLAPTFKLVWGIPGQSNALAIASRLGLGDSIVSSAKELLAGGSESRLRIESMIESLQQQTKDAEERLKEAESARIEAMEFRSELERRTDALKSQEERLRTAQQEVIDQEVRNAKSAIANVVREMQRKGSSSQSAAEAFEKMEKIERNGLLYDQHSQKSPSGGNFDAEELVKGVRVVVPRLGSKSVEVVDVEAGKGSKKDVVVLMGAFRVRIKQEEILEIVQPPSQSAMTGRNWIPRDVGGEQVNGAGQSRLLIKTAANTLDIRGARVDEGVAKLEIAMGRAVGYGTLYVVHGCGTGKLRKGVREWMRECDLIEKFEDAKPYDGGYGTTVVYLK